MKKKISWGRTSRARARRSARTTRVREPSIDARSNGSVRARERRRTRRRATRNVGAGKDREEGQRKIHPVGAVVLHERMRARSSRERRDGDVDCVLESSVMGSAAAALMELADDGAVIPFPPVGKVFSRLVDAVDERADEVVIHAVRRRRNLRWVGV